MFGRAFDNADEEISYEHVTARLDAARGVAEITVSGPDTMAPASLAGLH